LIVPWMKGWCHAIFRVLCPMILMRLVISAKWSK
jgi:hypothetical protein